VTYPVLLITATAPAAATARAQREKDEKAAQRLAYLAAADMGSARPVRNTAPEDCVYTSEDCDYTFATATSSSLEHRAVHHYSSTDLDVVACSVVRPDSDVTHSNVTNVLVPPAPEFYGMHALNTLYSDLNAVTVRANLTIAMSQLCIVYSFQKCTRACMITSACKIEKY
jgi:hypothetical protein